MKMLLLVGGWLGGTLATTVTLGQHQCSKSRRSSSLYQSKGKIISIGFILLLTVENW